MPWYNAGTVAVTNNSTAVTGSGTAWVGNVDAGQSLIGPDGLPYEIASVNSATSITLATGYRGATASGQAYRIMPVQGYLRDLALQAADLVLSFATVRDGVGQGKFADGTVGTPGVRFANDEDTGLYRPGANSLAFVVGGSEAIRIDGNGNVGFGTNSPINAAGYKFLTIKSGATGSGIHIQHNNGADVARLGYDATQVGIWNYLNIPMTFSVNGSERMRIDGSGRVGIGANNPDRNLVVYSSDTWVKIANASRSYMIGPSNGSNLNIYDETAGLNRLVLDTAGNFFPGSDNNRTLGIAAARWSVLYAGTGSINTSDQRAKQDITQIPNEWLDAWGALEWVRYKFKDSVVEKGGDARWHVGLVAQYVREAFADRGLDAQAIGLLCYDQWEEQREPIMEERQIDVETVIVGRVDTGLFDATGAPVFRDVTEERPVMGIVDTGETRVTLEARDRWGLRYDECQAMEAAWQRRELDRKDALIADLTARLDALEAA
ncbi:tail fiber domain-containing protein [Sphingobium bisphenolivorans]|uniref:tail fiber domain-containing protein n=1 Tax=Sphingobium bisphenolivorans TaxID=1335760 RepID=UPI0003A9FB8C|nr:tail fiber domain-containing protein [Sphingobium bisphenolivorans]